MTTLPLPLFSSWWHLQASLTPGLSRRHCTMTRHVCTVLCCVHDLYRAGDRPLRAPQLNNSAVRLSAAWCMYGQQHTPQPPQMPFISLRGRLFQGLNIAARVWWANAAIICLHQRSGIYKCRCNERKLSWGSSLSLRPWQDGGGSVWSNSEVDTNMPHAIPAVWLSIAHPLARHFAGSAVSMF